MRMTGAELIIRLLERQGVREVAGIPGGANLPLYDALSQSQQIRHILARHEQAGGFIAQGMARASGVPAVCFATSGPGATNILTAVADAKLDSIPIVCITGQVPTALIGTDAFQEVDTYGLGMSITKHNHLIMDVQEILTVIPQAFTIAASGRPGPVWIDVPKDIQNQVIEFDAWPEPGAREKTRALNPRALARSLQMIGEAKRPVLYVGGGVIQSESAGALRAFAEKAQIPVTMTLMGLGALPTDHPLSLGMLGMHAAPFTNLVLEECDLLMAVGVRFDDRATGKVAEFCPTAKVIHVDVDPAEIGKIRTPHVALTGDAGEALRFWLEAPFEPTAERNDWLARVQALKQSHPLELPGITDPRTPYGIIHAVAQAVPDAIVTTDVGQHQMWVAQSYPLMKPRHWLTSGGLGTMGFGLPAAIGAALAEPNRTVLCFSGDGSLLMNIQELATLAQENVNVKIILMNNQSLGLVHQQQDLFYGKRVFGADYTHAVAFDQIARACGVPAWNLEQAENPREFLAEILKQVGPALIHVPIHVQEKVFPMVPPGAANRNMIMANSITPSVSEPHHVDESRCGV